MWYLCSSPWARVPFSSFLTDSSLCFLFQSFIKDLVILNIICAVLATFWQSFHCMFYPFVSFSLSSVFTFVWISKCCELSSVWPIQYICKSRDNTNKSNQWVSYNKWHLFLSMFSTIFIAMGKKEINMSMNNVFSKRKGM